MPKVPRALVVLAVLAVLAPLAPKAVEFAVAQISVLNDDRFAGLQWTFARIKYASWQAPPSRSGGLRPGFWDEPWAIDAPAAEQNLSRRIGTVTAVQVGEPVVLTLTDEKLWQHPWIYIVEPSSMQLTDEEVAALREFLLRGGTLMMDDFHGPYEWDLMVRQMERVFPDRQIVEIEPPHSIYNCFYDLEKYPQVPGLGSFFNARTWEKGGYVAHLRGIMDDDGRPMVLINWNTDLGDGVEWSNAEEYPGYLRWTALAYQVMINQVVYSLTH